MENYGGFRTFYAIKYWDKARKTNGKGQDSPYFTWFEKKMHQNIYVNTFLAVISWLGVS